MSSAILRRATNETTIWEAQMTRLVFIPALVAAATFATSAFTQVGEAPREHSGAEGVGVDSDGNVYGAVVRRQMLGRHVKK
jgi:hypothetical protein